MFKPTTYDIFNLVNDLLKPIIAYYGNLELPNTKANLTTDRATLSKTISKSRSKTVPVPMIHYLDKTINIGMETPVEMNKMSAKVFETKDNNFMICVAKIGEPDDFTATVLYHPNYEWPVRIVINLMAIREFPYFVYYSIISQLMDLSNEDYGYRPYPCLTSKIPYNRSYQIIDQLITNRLYPLWHTAMLDASGEVYLTQIGHLFDAMDMFLVSNMTDALKVTASSSVPEGFRLSPEFHIELGSMYSTLTTPPLLEEEVSEEDEDVDFDDDMDFSEDEDEEVENSNVEEADENIEEDDMDFEDEEE